MNFTKPAWLAAAFALTASAALAAGNHAGGHDDEMAIGKPGQPSKVSRTIEMTMIETETGAMAFEPASIEVRRGETIRFAVSNAGVLEHELVIDTQDEVTEHKAVMEKFPEMIHDDPNAVRLAPGETGEIVWTFSNAGAFEFACLIPGHYGAGMHGPLTVSGS